MKKDKDSVFYNYIRDVAIIALLIILLVMSYAYSHISHKNENVLDFKLNANKAAYNALCIAENEVVHSNIDRGALVSIEALIIAMETSDYPLHEEFAYALNNIKEIYEIGENYPQAIGKDYLYDIYSTFWKLRTDGGMGSCTDRKGVGNGKELKEQYKIVEEELRTSIGELNRIYSEIMEELAKQDY